MTETNDLDSLLGPLKIALAMEVEGKQLFIEAARRATGKQARQTFEFLAAEEDKHIAHIKRFYESLESGEATDIPEIVAGSVDARFDEFNLGLVRLKDDLKPTASDVEAFRFAIKFENGAEDFYRQQAESGHDERATQFYLWLIDEEGLHARVLQSCLDFAENPSDWFAIHRRGD